MTEPLITVATFRTATEADLTRHRLEEVGLTAFVVADPAISAAPGAGAPGGFQVQVRENDADATREALAEYARGADDEPEEPLSRSDGLADRAFKTAVFGLLFCPIQAYSLWLLTLLLYEDEAVSPGRRWKMWTAVVLNLWFLSFLWWLAAGVSNR